MPCGVSPGRWLHKLDYKYLLPAMAALPLNLGERLSAVRGVTQFLLDYDWRSMAIGQRWIRARTYQAMRIMFPEASHGTWFKGTLLRFVHHSREEWQACLYRRKVMHRIKEASNIGGLDELRRCRETGRGVILISCHFDSFCMGMVLFGMNGLPVNVLNTAEIENPCILPQVRVFFQDKYRAMERLMHGRMAYYQTEMAFFYEALRRGEIVTLMGDIPGEKSTIYIPFLNRRLRMPLGAWHMARKTGSLVGGYVCLHEAPGHYRVICMPPQEIHPGDPEASLRPIYAFMETWIRKMPERWVTSDLLPGYPE